jgi:hypothetical protein
VNRKDGNMRRLFVLLATEEGCRTVVEALEGMGVPAAHLHVIAGLAHPLKDLPEASVWQRTELAHGIEWGLGLGGAAGLVGGLLAVSFPPAGLILGGGALMGTAAAGAGLGALVTALLGSQEHNHEFDAYQRAIAAGKLLLIVDISREQEEEVRSTILRHHPGAMIRSTGTETTQ